MTNKYKMCDGCSTGDCPHDDVNDCVKAQAKIIAALEAENKQLRKRRNEIDDEAFNYAEQIAALEAERDKLAGMLSIPLKDGSRLFIGDCFAVEGVYPFFNDTLENYNAELCWDEKEKTLWYDVYPVSDRVLGRACGGNVSDIPWSKIVRRSAQAAGLQNASNEKLKQTESKAATREAAQAAAEGE